MLRLQTPDRFDTFGLEVFHRLRLIQHQQMKLHCLQLSKIPLDHPITGDNQVRVGNNLGVPVTAVVNMHGQVRSNLPRFTAPIID